MGWKQPVSSPEGITVWKSMSGNRGRANIAEIVDNASRSLWETTQKPPGRSIFKQKHAHAPASTAKTHLFVCVLLRKDLRENMKK